MRSRFTITTHYTITRDGAFFSGVCDEASDVSGFTPGGVRERARRLGQTKFGGAFMAEPN
jgi:hypothetical protein